MRAIGLASSAAMNCGRKATKKIESLGLSTLSARPSTSTRRAERSSAAASTLSAPCSFSVCQAIQSR